MAMMIASGHGPRADTATPLDRTRSSSSRRLLLEYAGVAFVFVFVTTVVGLGFWPGRMSADTLAQIAQIRRNAYSDHHTPILQALWHPFFVNGAGPGWILTMQTLCFLSGVWLILRLTFRRVPAALAAALVVFAPPTFGMMGWLGRDVWFASLLVLSFGLVATAYRSTGRKRVLICVSGVLAAWLALAARQNAAVSVVVPIILLAFLMLRGWRGDRWSTAGLAARAAGAGMLATLVLMASQQATKEAIGVRAAYPTGPIFVYDLAMFSLDDRENHFPRSVVAQRDMAVITQLANVDSIDPMLVSPAAPIRWPMRKQDDEALRAAWFDRVISDPLSYLNVRTRLFLRQIGLTRDALWTYHPFIDPNPWGYQTTFHWANDIANDYVGAFSDEHNNGGALHAAWIYLLACAVAIVVCLRRRTTVRVLVAALASMPLLYQVGLYFGAMGTSFRLEYPAVVLGTVVFVFGVQFASQLARARLLIMRGTPASAAR